MKNKFVLTLVWLLTTAAALGQNLIPLPNRADKRTEASCSHAIRRS